MKDNRITTMLIWLGMVWGTQYLVFEPGVPPTPTPTEAPLMDWEPQRIRRLEDVPPGITPYYPPEAPEIHTEIRPTPEAITEPYFLPGGISIIPSTEAPRMVVQIPYQMPMRLWY